jgi:hypothetical protein
MNDLTSRPVPAAKRTAADDLLLHTLLATEPPAACTAWEKWLAAIDDPLAHLRADCRGLRRVLPLLLESVQRNGLAVPAAFLTVLRSAHVREELRDRTYRRILAALLDGLHNSGIEAILVNGAALAHSVYPQPLLRHCHNIDLYCNVFHIKRLTQLLLALGFRETAHNGECLEFVHDSGLPVELHRRLPGADHPLRRFTAVHARSNRLEIDARAVRVLAAEDALLQISARCRENGGTMLPWRVCDAWMQLERGTAPDHGRLREAASASGLTRTLDSLLEVLAAVPGAVAAPCLASALAATGEPVRPAPRAWRETNR